MNNTKWEELRKAMLELTHLRPRWRTRDCDTGYLSDWDGEWYYHFRQQGYKSIEYADIEISSTDQSDAVLEKLMEINVPGHRIPEGFRIFGWVTPGSQVDYLRRD